MKLIPAKFPFNIPQIFATFVSGIFVAFFMAGTILESKLGRPSSTSSIAFVFIPICAVIIYMAGYTLGVFIRPIVAKFISERNLTEKSIRNIYSILLATCIASAIAGGLSFKSHEDAQKPQVIHNSAGIEKITDLSFKEANQSEATLLYKSFDEEKISQKELIWNNKPIRLEVNRNENSLSFLNDAGNEIIFLDLKKHDYITDTYALPFSHKETNVQYLAVLTHLRATSKRSMLYILNSEALIIYQELIHRYKYNPMKVVRDTYGKEYLWLNLNNSVFYSVGSAS